MISFPKQLKNDKFKRRLMYVLYLALQPRNLFSLLTFFYSLATDEAFVDVSGVHCFNPGIYAEFSRVLINEEFNSHNCSFMFEIL